MKIYAEYVYQLLKNDTEGMDSIYEDYIIRMIGLYGLTALENCQLIETCGVVNGRQLYTLLDNKTENKRTSLDEPPHIY